MMLCDSVMEIWSRIGTQVDRREAVLGSLGGSITQVEEALSKEGNRSREVEARAREARNALIARAKAAYQTLKKPPPDAMLEKFDADHGDLNMDALNRLEARVLVVEKLVQPIQKTAEAKAKLAEGKQKVEPLKAAAKAKADEAKKVKANTRLEKKEKKDAVALLKSDQKAIKADVSKTLAEAKFAARQLKDEAARGKAEIKAIASSPEMQTIRAYTSEKKYKKLKTEPLEVTKEFDNTGRDLDATMKKAQAYIKARDYFNDRGIPKELQNLMFQQMRGTPLDKLTQTGVKRWESRPPETTPDGEVIIPNPMQGLLWIVDGIPEPRGVTQRLVSLYDARPAVDRRRHSRASWCDAAPREPLRCKACCGS